MTLARAAIVALLTACLDATAQSPRSRVVGRVVAKDGTPWAGATVTLLAHPIPSRPDVGEADRVVVTSDGQGRFAAEVLPRFVYRAWAEAESGTERRVSFLQTDVMAQSVLRLAESPARRPPRQADPTRDWREDEVQVVDADQKPIGGAILWCRAEQAPAAPLPESGEAPLRWSRVTGTAAMEAWVRAGATDAEGKAKVKLPRRSSDVVVEAEGYALGYRTVAGKEPILLSPAKALCGRLLHGQKPLAGVTLVPDYPVSVTSGRGRQHFRFAPPPVVTAADGSFEISGPADDVPVRLDALLPDELCRRLWPRLQVLPVPQAWIASAGQRTGGDGQQPGDVDLAQVAPAAIEVTRADGSPVQGADVLIRAMAGPATGQRPRPVVLTTDRRGLACVLLPSGSYQVLVVAGEAGWLCETIEAGKATAPQHLTLAPQREIRLRVVDGKGAAVADARLYSSGGSYTHVSGMFEEAFQWNQAAVVGRTDASGVCLLRLLPWPQQEIQVQVSGGGATAHARVAAAVASDELEIVLTK